MISEIHITSVVVHASPATALSVVDSINESSVASVALSDTETGRIVVLLESPSMKIIDDAIQQFRSMTGVFSVAMIYHQVEAPDQLNETLV